MSRVTHQTANQGSTLGPSTCTAVLLLRVLFSRRFPPPIFCAEENRQKIKNQFSNLQFSAKGAGSRENREETLSIIIGVCGNVSCHVEKCGCIVAEPKVRERERAEVALMCVAFRDAKLAARPRETHAYALERRLLG